MINYGVKNEQDGMFYNIYPSIFAATMCGYEHHEISEIEFVEDVNGEYWSFQDTGKDTFHLIYPHKILFNICFPYGPDIEVEKGNGRIVRLKIKNSKILT